MKAWKWLLPALLPVLLCLGPVNSTAAMSEKQLDDLLAKMRVDVVRAYDFGYKKSHCNPQQEGLTKKDRIYVAVALFPKWCQIGVNHKQQGVPYNKQKLLQVVDKVLAAVKTKVLQRQAQQSQQGGGSQSQ